MQGTTHTEEFLTCPYKNVNKYLIIFFTQPPKLSFSYDRFSIRFLKSVCTTERSGCPSIWYMTTLKKAS